MATLVPSYGSCARRMTNGEKRVAQRLESHLEDDYLCWYDVPIGGRQLHPDFVVLHPGRGLLILEVKDWRLDSIHSVDKIACVLKSVRGLKQEANPLEQARQYAFAVHNLLAQDSLLIAPPNSDRAGRLLFPYGYGVVLTNITRKQFDAHDMGSVMESSRVICQDEMTEAVNAEDFQKRLWDMLPYRFGQPLSLPQIDRIRWRLFPEIRITQTTLDLQPSEGKGAEPLPDLMRVMDVQQEQLARSLGEGHRIIHGVAGSGKTLILGYRCERLARALVGPILVLCYNVALASKLAHVIAQKGLTETVNVRNFHAWCSDQLKLYHVPRPEPGEGFFERLVQSVIEAVDRGQIPRAQYGAVLIDEGHDFKPEWLKLVVQMVDPQTDALLLLYDDGQSIYERRTKRKLSFKALGIRAQGRTTILKLNYRNTAEVLQTAYDFAKDVLRPEDADEDGVPLVEPTSAGRHGPKPVLVKLPSFRAEVDHLAKRLMAAHNKGRPWSEMAVLYRSKFMGEELAKGLRAAGLPVDWLQEDGAKRRYDPAAESVKLLTMHSSKGLEFPLVAIPGLGFMPRTEKDDAEEARVLYVAMTRAMDELVMTCSRPSAFVQRLDAVGLARAA